MEEIVRVQTQQPQWPHAQAFLALDKSARYVNHNPISNSYFARLKVGGLDMYDRAYTTMKGENGFVECKSSSTPARN